METTAKCVSVGPAHCRERGYPVRYLSASIQLGELHSGGPRAGSGNGTRSRYSLKEGSHRGGSSSQKGVRVHSSKEGWRFGLILDWRQLNRSVSRLKFRMLTIRQVVTQIRSEDWFVPIYLEDAYFHISILPTHRKFLWFAFGGKAYQYRVLPFALALSPRTFTKCVDATFALLWLCCGMVYAPDLFPVLWPGLTGQPRLFHPLALDLLCRDIHWEGTVKSGSIGISFPQLEFPKKNPGFSRERDAASRCHTSGIQCWLHSSCRHWMLLYKLAITSPRLWCLTNPWTDFTYVQSRLCWRRSPSVLRRSVSFPWGTYRRRRRRRIFYLSHTQLYRV